MMKSHRSIIAIIVAGLAISACSDQQPPRVQYVPVPAQSAPVGHTWDANTGQYVPQVPQYAPQQPVVVDNSGISSTTALLGAAAVGTAAYMAGKANGQNQVSNAPTTRPTPTAAPVTVTPSAPAKMAATPVTPAPAAAKPFEPVRVHPQPTAAPAPVAAPKPATPAPAFKPVTVSSTPSYKPSTPSSSFKPSSGRK